MNKTKGIQKSNFTKGFSLVTRTSVLISLSVLLILGLGLSGCSFPDSGIDANEGALVISIGGEASASRSLLPNINMDPVEYQISGSGPDGASFTASSSGEDSYINGLAIGEWQISVTAMNIEGDPIGYGENTVLIEGSKQSSVVIDIVPLTGNGTLTLSVNWPDAEVVNPGLTGVLTDSAGVSQSLIFIMGTGQADYINTGITAGYYTLSLQLFDGEDVIAGLVDTVRIVQDAETVGTYSFTDLNHPIGDVEIIVIVDLDTPLEVTITGTVDILSYGTNMTVQMLVANPGDDVINYQWYLNGGFIGTGETLTFGMDLRSGTYRLDGVAISADGERSGSAFHSFTVE